MSITTGIDTSTKVNFMQSMLSQETLLREAARTYEGKDITLAAFGPAVVRKIYMHHKTREVCADVRARSGELLHLSLRYLDRLIDG